MRRCVHRPPRRRGGYQTPTDTDIEKSWADYEIARREICDDDDDPVVLVPLSDGDVHLCRGHRCPHVELLSDKSYVCALTGMYIGVLSTREDRSTGRFEGSNDVDLKAGEVVVKWKAKRNAVDLSEQAVLLSQNIDDAMPVPSSPSDETVDVGKVDLERVDVDEPAIASAQTQTKRGRKRKNIVKRGARCVDEVAAAPEPKKRALVETTDAMLALTHEAACVIRKLVCYTEKAERNVDENVALRHGRVTVDDPRLCDEHALYENALRRYVKEVVSSGGVPTLDDAVSLSIVANKVSSEAKQRATTMALQKKNASILLRVRVREILSSLIAQIWVACEKTPYMITSRRPSDSFKPLAAGLVYALKRGVFLSSGSAILPKCPELTSALPVLRETARGSAAKSLHSASHRGLCTLHRAMASCEDESVFSDCVHSATLLASVVTSGRYDA